MKKKIFSLPFFCLILMILINTPLINSQIYNNELIKPQSAYTYTALSSNAEVDTFFSGSSSDALSWNDAYNLSDQVFDDYSFYLAYTSKYIIIENCRFQNLNPDGNFHNFYSCLGFYSVQNIKVINCTFDTTWDGIALEQNTNNINITDSLFLDNRNSIVGNYIYKIYITGNYFESINTKGIDLTNFISSTDASYIAYNFFIDCTDAIDIGGGSVYCYDPYFRVGNYYSDYLTIYPERELSPEEDYIRNCLWELPYECNSQFFDNYSLAVQPHNFNYTYNTLPSSILYSGNTSLTVYVFGEYNQTAFGLISLIGHDFTNYTLKQRSLNIIPLIANLNQTQGNNFYNLTMDNGSISMEFDFILAISNNNPSILTRSEIYCVVGSNEPKILSWTISDDSVIMGTYYYYLNGTLDSTGEWNNGKKIEINVQYYPLGTYIIYLNASDNCGGYATTTTKLHMIEFADLTFPEENATTNETTTNGTTPEGFNWTIVYWIVGIVGGVSIIGVASYFIYKRVKKSKLQ